MNELSFSLKQLQGVIGRLVRYRNNTCRIIEVLHEGPALVLEDLDAANTIQADQYGNPGRRVARVYTIPVLESDGITLHNSFLDLEIID